MDLHLHSALRWSHQQALKFTASSKGTLTLVFAESGKNVKINGKKKRIKILIA